jgi:hypothetical protein
MNSVLDKTPIAAKRLVSLLWTILANPAGRILTLLLIGVVITVQLFMLHNLGTDYPPGYTSDDVAQQTILAQWDEGYTAKAVLGDDNWSLKFPLYIAMNHAPMSPATRIFVTSWLLTIATVFGAALTLWGIARRFATDQNRKMLALVALPAVAIAALSPRAIYIISIVNTRNIEIPLFLLLLLTLLYFDSANFQVNKHRYQILGAVALIALLLADDPLFLYMGAIPLVALLAVRALFPGRALIKTAQLLGIVAAGWVASQLLRLGLTHLLPISFYPHASSIASPGVLASNVAILLTKDLQLFNVYLRGPVFSLGTIVTLLSLGLLIAGLYACLRLFIAGWNNKTGSLSLQYLGLLPFWIAAVLLATTFSSGITYLILVPFVLAACVIIAAAKGLFGFHLPTAISISFLVCAAVNTGASADMLVRHPVDMANSDEQAIVSVLRANDLTKGFATYWHANIVTYLSDYDITVISVSCNTPGIIEPYAVLEEPAILSKRALKSFMLFYPTRERDQNECTLPQITSQFGTPAEILAVPTSAGAKIAVYDHDITSSLSPGVAR